MKKISIKLDDALYKKINDRVTKNEYTTLSQCARELIDLGIRVEEAASSQSEKYEGSELHPLLVELLKTNMIWSLETRLLARFLVEHKQDIEPGEGMNFMAKAKKSAASHVVKLLEEAQKS